MKILIPVDGSECALRAVRHAIKMIRACAGHDKPEVHLINVQPSLRGAVGMFIAVEDIKDYHREEGLKVLEPARKLLEEAGMEHRIHIDVGTPAHVIDRYSREFGIEQIVMGTRGHGLLADIVLGSTSEELLHVTSIPVLLVK